MFAKDKFMISLQDLQKIIKAGESDTVEFKSAVNLNILNTICAMANGKGGYIIIGVTNHGEIVGYDNKEQLNVLKSHISKMQPTPPIYNFNSYNVENKSIVVIEVIGNEKKIYHIDGLTYIREGTGTVEEPLIDTKYNGELSYYAQTNDTAFSIRTKTVSPCFNVEFISEIFAKHLDEINSEDSQMIGIFGRWGRGKTYFWGKVKNQLKRLGNYSFVEFNAWKYQETPAIWAYLFKTFQDSLITSQIKKFFYNVRQHCLRLVFCICILLIIIFIILSVSGIIKFDSPLFNIILISASVLIFIIDIIKNNLSTITQIIKNDIKGKNYDSFMGCQVEIEEDLAKLLKYHTKKDKMKDNKVVLYIDDIDRCEDKRMLKVIDSLRVILENEDIMQKLIVVCSIDCDRLKKVLHDKYGNKVREHIDKIFISGIYLKNINYDEQIDFISNLINDNYIKLELTNNPQLQNNERDNLSDTSNIELNKSKSALYGKISKNDELAVFRKILNDPDASDITPRQLRIIYYRYRLANNILSGYAIPHDLIAKAIYCKTLGRECPKLNLAPSYQDVVDMVVCY